MFEDSTSTPFFLVTIPKELATSIHARVEGTKSNTGMTIGEVVCTEPYVSNQSHLHHFQMSFKNKINNNKNNLLLKGERSGRSERILVHERTTEDTYRKRSSQEMHLLPQKRTPDQISFKGSVTHTCRLMRDPRAKNSLLEMGK